MKKIKESTVKIILVEFPEGGCHLFINLKVNGKKCRFLVDSGASKSVVDKKYFEENFGKKNLRTIKQETSSLHGSVPESHYGKVKELEVGPHKVKNVDIAAIDLSHVNSVYKQLKKAPILGILGSELMMKYQMILDYGRLKIIFP